ncbi:hypothetical protein BDR05DRAFT_996017 [Suillus weaverae]|nr:hypothetical protein BDR05DRAFT_996017 [Suillus weaverae]
MRSLKVMWPLFNIGDFSTSNHLLVHLTNLELAISQLKAVPHLLHLCPNLSSLTICVSVKQRLLAIESFTHTKLQSLCITHDLGNTEHLTGLFNALSFPNLCLLEAQIQNHRKYLSCLMPSHPSGYMSLQLVLYNHGLMNS